MRADPIAVIEAAYAPIEDEQAWLTGVIDAARAFGPIYGHVIGRDSRVRALGASDPAIVDALRRTHDAAMDRLSPEMKWAHHMPSPAVELTSVRERRIGRAFGVGDVWLETTFRDVVARSDLTMMSESIAITAGDPEGASAMVLALMNRSRISPREHATLTCISAHLGTALRLRNVTSEHDAIFDGAGRPLDARLESQAFLPQLKRAIGAMDRSRGRTRKTSPSEAAALWRAMVEGRWSLVERVERDGKRLILARRNRPKVREILALTAIERVVIAFVALGHSNKHVGYELGLAATTVASHLARAMRKLRVRTRRDLIRYFGPLARTQRDATSKDSPRDGGRRPSGRPEK